MLLFVRASSIQTSPGAMDFDTACEVVRNGLFSATDEEKLELYALYQVAHGRGSAPRGDSSRVERAKRDAVQSYAHLSPLEASGAYVAMVEAKLLGCTD